MPESLEVDRTTNGVVGYVGRRRVLMSRSWARAILGRMALGLMVPFLLAWQTASPAAPATLPTSVSVETAASLPAGTPLWIRGTERTAMRVGQPIDGTLVYATFADNREVFPAGSVAHGTIVSLAPDKAHRLQARLRGDFTPFARPVVQFQEVVLPDGTHVPLQLGAARDGAPVLQLTPPPAAKGGLLRREFDTGMVMVKDRIRTVTAPGKMDRLKDLLYSQLPYHPQRINAGTVWTVETTAVADVPQRPNEQQSAPVAMAAAPKETEAPRTWTLDAYLAETVSSQRTRVGAPIRAVVAKPVVDTETGEVEVPQGAVLEGEVTRARPARRFGRAGELQFAFKQMTFPGSATRQDVQTTLQGVDAVGDSNLSLDREGQVKPKPKDKLAVPVLLFALAARPLDRDHGDNAFGKDAVASNSLGVIGFLVGTAGGWRNVAAGIGYYGAAISVWNRWIKRGDETTLRQDTRIVVQTTARRSAPMTPGLRTPR